MPGGSPCHTRINISCLNQCLFIILMNITFFCYHKLCAHLHSSCSQHKGCCNSSAICDSTGCNYRYRYCINNLRNQYHRSQFSNMSPGFRSFCYKSIRTTAFHSLCQRHACHYRNYLHTGFFPHAHIFFRTSGTCRYNCHAFFYQYFRDLIGFRIHQHQIDTKWLICQFLCFSHLLSDPFCRCASASDQSKTSCIRHGSRQMIICHPGHASLDNRITNS